MKMNYLAAVLALMTLPTWAETAPPVSLTVVLAGVQHAGGSVRVGLYDSPATFRKEARAFASQEAPAQQGTVRVTFAAVPPGEYAVMAYHDEDGNGEMNRRFGMFPTEGYGLSNNPVIAGPPAFADSAFRIEPGQSRELPISMRY